MQTIILQDIENPSYERLNKLLKDAFAERLAAGLNFAAASHTTEHLREYLQDKQTFVICNERQEYIATFSYKICIDRHGKKYGELFHLAVSPNYRCRGMSQELFRLCCEACKKEGAQYIKSHTAIHATSSVQSHLKEGFEIRKMFYNGGGGYYSYLFIKEFTPPSSIVRIQNRLGYLKSIFTCRIRKIMFKLKHGNRRKNI